MKIKVVMLRPEKAYITEIDNSLFGMQKIVGELIEAVYPFEEQVCIVCNEEGKINGSLPNRAVYADNSEIVDIICGTAFICDCSGNNFGSLSEEQLNRFCHLFQYPELFLRIDGKILALPFVSSRDKHKDNGITN